MQTRVGGLSSLQNLLEAHLDRDLFIANGVAGPVPQKPFQVMMMNLSRAPRYLPKSIVHGHVLPHSTRIVTPIAEGEASLDDVVESEDALAGLHDEPAEQSAEQSAD